MTLFAAMLIIGALVLLLFAIKIASRMRVPRARPGVVSQQSAQAEQSANATRVSTTPPLAGSRAASTSGPTLAGFEASQAPTLLVDKYDHRVVDAAFTPDGRMIVCSETAVGTWVMAEGRLLRNFASSSGRFGSHRIAPSFRLVALDEGGPNDVVSLWDVAAGRRLKTLAGPADAPFAFSLDGRTLAASTSKTGPNYSSRYCVSLWDVESGRLRRDLPDDTHWLHALQFLPDGSLLSAGDAGIVRWDTAGGTILCSFEHSAGVHTLCVSSDGTLAVSGGVLKEGEPGYGLIRTWDVARGVELCRFEGDAHRVSAIAVSADKALVATGDSTPGRDSKVRLWSTATGKELAVLKTHQAEVSFLAFLRNNDFLASGDYAGRICLTKIPTSIAHIHLDPRAMADAAARTRESTDRDEALRQLMKAMDDDNPSAVLELLASNPGLSETTLPFERTVLHWAAELRHADVVRLILTLGADVNASSIGGATPLHFAARQGSDAVVAVLLEHGADRCRRDREGWTPLHHAAAGENNRLLDEQGKAAVTKRLISSGADVNALSDPGVGLDGKHYPGVTPLRIASEWEFKVIAEIIRASGGK
jgi:WD40 repeat protein